MIYILLFVMLLASPFIRGERKLYKIGLLAIISTTCLRAQTIGVDTKSGYHNFFNWINSGATLAWIEPGWVVLNKIAIWLGLGYQGVLAISGFLTIIPMSYVIQKTSANKRYSLAVYYSMFFVIISYNLMRQMIAVSFALLAVYFYVNKNLKYALCWFIIGLLFHKSILIVLPAIFFLRLDIKYSKVVLCVFISFLCGLLLSNSFYFIISGSYGKYLLSNVSYRGFRSSLLKPAFFSLIFDAFFLFFIRFKYCVLRKNPYFLLSLLGVVIMNLTMRLGQGARIVLYFSQMQIICFPNYLNELKSNKSKATLTLLYTVFLTINFMRLLLGDWENINPYSFFWE